MFVSVAGRRVVRHDSIRKLAVQNDQRRFDFVCECGDLDCTGLVNVSIAEYDSRGAGLVLAHGVG